jgi:hypothetical protein
METLHAIFLQEQPILIAGFFNAPECSALEALTVNDLDFVAFPEFGFVVAFIPDFHCSGTILTFGDFALKTAIFVGVIFGFHCQNFLASLRDPFWNCPTLEHTVFFQPQVIVEPSCMVLLDNKY